MKSLSILTLASALLMLTSCVENEETYDPKDVNIAGRVVDAKDGRVVLFANNEEVASDSIADDGTFQINFPKDKSGRMMIRFARLSQDIYAAPGDSIHVVIDSQATMDAFDVTGSNSVENNYLVAKAEKFSSLGFQGFPGIWALEPAQFLHQKDSLSEEYAQVLAQLKLQEGVDEKFLKLEEAYFQYYSLHLDLMYPNYHGYFSGSYPDSIEFPFEEVQRQAALVPDNDPDLLEVEPVLNILEARLSDNLQAYYEAEGRDPQSMEEYSLVAYNLTDTLFENPDVKAYFKYQQVKDVLGTSGPAKAKELYDLFNTEYSSGTYVEALQKINEKWQPLLPGKDVPEFTFVNMEDAEVKLSDLRGELAYIDVWATWCGPCIAEHPHWDSLKTEYSGRPVAFVTISIDSSPEPWKKMVTDKGMDGYQWHAANDWNSALAKHFMINSIPRFILLDAQGKVIDASADRPSGDIRKVLNENLAAIELASK